MAVGVLWRLVILRVGKALVRARCRVLPERVSADTEAVQVAVKVVLPCCLVACLLPYFVGRIHVGILPRLLSDCNSSFQFISVTRGPVVEWWYTNRRRV